MAKGKKRKKSVSATVAVVMVCCLVIVGTLAWLLYRTQEEVNTFVLGAGIKIELKEEKYQKDERKNDFTPEMFLDKDPTVYIPEDAEMQEYIAITVHYYKETEDIANGNIELEEITYDEFKNNYADIYSFKEKTEPTKVTGSAIISSTDEKNYDLEKGIRNGWFARDNTNTVFYFGEKEENNINLTPVTSGASITLFDKVRINNPYNNFYNNSGTYNVYHGETLETTRPVSKGQLMGFRIDICAYAVQGNISSEEGKAALDSLISQHP